MKKIITILCLLILPITVNAKEFELNKFNLYFDDTNYETFYADDIDEDRVNNKGLNIDTIYSKFTDNVVLESVYMTEEKRLYMTIEETVNEEVEDFSNYDDEQLHNLRQSDYIEEYNLKFLVTNNDEAKTYYTNYNHIDYIITFTKDEYFTEEDTNIISDTLASMKIYSSEEDSNIEIINGDNKPKESDSINLVWVKPLIKYTIYFIIGIIIGFACFKLLKKKKKVTKKKQISKYIFDDLSIEFKDKNWKINTNEKFKNNVVLKASYQASYQASDHRNDYELFISINDCPNYNNLNNYTNNQIKELFKVSSICDIKNYKYVVTESKTGVKSQIAYQTIMNKKFYTIHIIKINPMTEIDRMIFKDIIDDIKFN